jgi:hypothetical protein
MLVSIAKADEICEVGLNTLAVGKFGMLQFLLGKDFTVEDEVVLIGYDMQVPAFWGVPLGLYRKDPHTGEKLKGYLEDNGRVRSITMRGQTSDGIVLRKKILADFFKISEDFRIVQNEEENYDIWVGDEKVVREFVLKYKSKAVREWQAKVANPPKIKHISDLSRRLPEHYKTNHFKASFSGFSPEKVYYITEKLHGTSGRTAHIRIDRTVPLNRFERAINYFADLFSIGQLFSEKRLHVSEYVSGTRRTFSVGAAFRQAIHKKIEAANIPVGDAIYYEIVGFNGQAAIQKSKSTIFRYGCALEEAKFYVYRVTRNGQDLSFASVISYCEFYKLPYVPVLRASAYRTQEELRADVEALAEQPTVLDTHISEGVCVIEDEPNARHQKHKSKQFLNASEDSDDPEDLS